MTADSNREVRFHEYLWGHYSEAHGLSVYGVALTVLFAPVLSLLRPNSVAFATVLATVGGLGCALLVGYLASRVVAYYILRRRTLSQPRSWLAGLGHPLMVSLVCLAPFAASDQYFEKGWLVALVPTMEQAQDDLVALAHRGHQWARSRLAPGQVQVATTSQSADSQDRTPPANSPPTGSDHEQSVSDSSPTGVPGSDPEPSPPSTPAEPAVAGKVREDTGPEDTGPEDTGPETPEAIEPGEDEPGDAAGPDESPTEIELRPEAGSESPSSDDSGADTGPAAERPAAERPDRDAGGPRTAAVPTLGPTATPAPAAPGADRAFAGDPAAPLPPFRFAGQAVVLEFPGDESNSESAAYFGAPLRQVLFQAPRRAPADLHGQPPSVVVLEQDQDDSLHIRDLFSLHTCEIPSGATRSHTPIETFQQVPFEHQLRYIAWRLLAATLPVAGRITGKEGPGWHTTLGLHDGVKEGDLLRVFELPAAGKPHPRLSQLRLKHFQEQGSIAVHDFGSQEIGPDDYVLPATAPTVKIAVMPARIRFTGSQRAVDFDNEKIEEETARRGPQRSFKLVEYCHERGGRLATALQAAVAALDVPHVDPDGIGSYISTQFSVPWWSWEPGSAFRAGSVLRATHVWFAEIEPRSSKPPCNCEVRFHVLDVGQNRVIDTYEFLLSQRQAESLLKWSP